LRRRAVDISINAFTMECVYLGVSPRYTTPLLHNACQRARGRCPRRKDAARIVDLAGCAAVHAGRYRTNAKPRPSLQPTGRARLMNRAGNGYPPRSRTSGRRRCASNDVGPDVGTTRQPPVVKVTPGVTAHRDWCTVSDDARRLPAPSRRVVGAVKKEIAGQRRFSFVHARAAAASIGQRW